MDASYTSFLLEDALKWSRGWVCGWWVGRWQEKKGKQSLIRNYSGILTYVLICPFFGVSVDMEFLHLYVILTKTLEMANFLFCSWGQLRKAKWLTLHHKARKRRRQISNPSPRSANPMVFPLKYTLSLWKIVHIKRIRLLFSRIIWDPTHMLPYCNRGSRIYGQNVSSPIIWGSTVLEKLWRGLWDWLSD